MIRPASVNDLSAIDDIYNQAVERGFCTAHVNPMSKKERIAWFHGHQPNRYPVYIYEENNKVIGWASFSPYRPGRKALQESTEISFYVDFNCQGQGIGTQLVEHCLNTAALLKKRVLFSIIIEGNEKSIGLLEKFGFDQWGYLPEVIRLNGEVRGHVYMGKVLYSHDN